MQTLVSFLRGINMTGYNSMKMKDLTDLYIDLGFSNVETYIQSGNVIFSFDENIKDEETSAIINKGILNKFGYNIAVAVRTVPELRLITKSNPFLSEASFDPAKTAVIFLTDNPSVTGIEKLKETDTSPDKYAISGKEIFIYCPNGFGKTKLYANFFDKKLNVQGTTRNWKTVNAMINLADKRKL